MKYRNTRTGAVIDIPCEIKGEWEPVKEEKPKEEAPAQKKKRTPKK